MTWKFLYNNCKEQNNDIDRIVRTEKSCFMFYKAIYYIIVTSYGWWVLKDTDFLVPSLGGRKENVAGNMWNNFPVIEEKNNYNLRMFYIVIGGYHFSSIVILLMRQRKNDFMEMLVHHIATATLIVMSYLSNMVKGGSQLIWLHGWADITVSLLKAFSETSFNFGFVFFGLINLAIWPWSRFYAFVDVLYNGYITLIPQLDSVFKFNSEQDKAKTINFCHMVVGLHLCLLSLHIYWYGLQLALVCKIFQRAFFQKN